MAHSFFFFQALLQSLQLVDLLKFGKGVKAKFLNFFVCSAPTNITLSLNFVSKPHWNRPRNTWKRYHVFSSMKKNSPNDKYTQLLFRLAPIEQKMREEM